MRHRKYIREREIALSQQVQTPEGSWRGWLRQRLPGLLQRGCQQEKQADVRPEADEKVLRQEEGFHSQYPLREKGVPGIQV